MSKERRRRLRSELAGEPVPPSAKDLEVARMVDEVFGQPTQEAVHKKELEILAERRRQAFEGAKLRASVDAENAALRQKQEEEQKAALVKFPKRPTMHKHNTVYERARIRCECGKIFLTQLAVELCEGRGHAPLQEKKNE